MIFVPLKDIKWIDQSAHFIIGALLVWLSYKYTDSYLLSIWFSMSFSFLREMYQHWKQVGVGSRTDLLFWFLGSLTGALF